MSTVYTRTMVRKLKFEEHTVLACFLHLIFYPSYTLYFHLTKQNRALLWQ